MLKPLDEFSCHLTSYRPTCKVQWRIAPQSRENWRVEPQAKTCNFLFIWFTRRQHQSAKTCNCKLLLPPSEWIYETAIPPITKLLWLFVYSMNGKLMRSPHFTEQGFIMQV